MVEITISYIKNLLNGTQNFNISALAKVKWWSPSYRKTYSAIGFQ